MSGRSLRICLDARLSDGVAGGVQQFVAGLAGGLSRLRDGSEEYLFLSRPGERRWLEPHLSGPCRPLDADGVPPAGAASGGAVRRALATVVRALAASPAGALLPVTVPRSDGTVEAAGVDLMHFTVQSGFLTDLPSIYQPYDLQHVHLPQFFTPHVRRMRQVVYSELCRRARAVVVMSSWVKDDVVARLKLAPEKVRVISWAPVTEEYPVPSQADLEQARRDLELPAAFALYPAQTFPHKNHVALVHAVALARSQGVDLRVVCSGAQNEHYGKIASEVRRLHLEAHVRFVGYVSPLQLRCLYALARMMVFPSLFEGGAMPIFEAFASGTPVAASAVTSIPKQSGDAVVLFDPASPAAIADAMVRLWGDPGLRLSLVQRGRERVAQFSWDRTARTYRALYRMIAGAPSAEDLSLLDAPPET